VSNIDKLASAGQAAIQSIGQGKRQAPQKAFLLEAQKLASGESQLSGKPAQAQKSKAVSISKDQADDPKPDADLPRGSIVDILA